MTKNENIEYCLNHGYVDILNKLPHISNEELSELVEATKYPQRRIDGQEFSDVMGARLVLLDAPDNVKKIISEFFEQSQAFLCQGWWLSAVRDMQTKTPNQYVGQPLIDEITQKMNDYISTSY